MPTTIGSFRDQVKLRAKVAAKPVRTTATSPKVAAALDTLGSL
jgi:hypothetical protein